MTLLEAYGPSLDRELCALLDLTAHGYVYSGVKEKRDAALGSHLEAIFSHPITHRKVTVAYLPPHNLSEKEVLVVHVTKNSLDAYSGTFSVNDFLRSKGATPDAIRNLTLSA